MAAAAPGRVVFIEPPFSGKLSIFRAPLRTPAEIRPRKQHFAPRGVFGSFGRLLRERSTSCNAVGTLVCVFFSDLQKGKPSFFFFLTRIC